MKEVIFFDYQSKFSTKLRDLIEEKGITKQKLSEEIGVSRQAISQYCDGSTVPNADKFLKIAEFFDVSLDYLVGKTESKTPVDSVEGELVRAICDYTGLNEKSVHTLECCRKNEFTTEDFEEKNMFDFLNYFLDIDNIGVFALESAGTIKSELIYAINHLKKTYVEETERFKCNSYDEEIAKEHISLTEKLAKGHLKKEIGYRKYEAEKLFGHLLDEYIKDAEQEFKKELDIKWQL